MRPNQAILRIIPGNHKTPHDGSNAPATSSLSSRAKFQIFLDDFETYLEQHSLSPATIRNYLVDLRAFVRWHGLRHQPAIDPTAADFSAFRDYLLDETDHSTSTVNRRLQSLRLFGRFLQEMGYAAENPARGIELLRNGNGAVLAPRTLTHLEIAQLTQAIRAGRPSLVPRDYAIMQLMLQAGLRVHEIAAMRLGDLRPTRNGMSLGVGDPGRGGVRVVPLKLSVVRALRDYLPTRPALPRVDHLFLSQRGQPLSMRSIQRLIDSHARAAGLQGVCAQSLRHTCTKAMLEETRDLALVARWLGCRDAKSLERFGLGG